MADLPDWQTQTTEVSQVYIKADGSVDFTNDQSMASNKLTNLAAPVANNDAARKTDVDTVNARLDDIAQNDVTASRAIGSDYHNTSGKIMLVSVTAYAAIGLTNAIYLEARSDANGTPVLEVGSVNIPSMNVVYPKGNLVFAVKPSDYYKVISAGSVGAVTLEKWIEWPLF